MASENNTIYVYNQTMLMELIKQDMVSFLKKKKKAEKEDESDEDGEVETKKKKPVKKNIEMTSHDYSKSLDYAYRSIKKIANDEQFMIYADKWIMFKSFENMVSSCMSSVKETYPTFIKFFKRDLYKYEVCYDFDPSKPSIDHDGRFVNLYIESPWKNSDIEPSEDFVAIWKDFILKIVANGNKEIATFLLMWVANLVVHGRKNDTVITIMSSQEGVGKSTFSRIIGNLIAPSMTHMSKIEEWCAWTINLRHKLLINQDETGISSEQVRVSAGTTLKNFVTEPFFSFVGKGTNFKEERATASVIITSNHPISFADDGRRICKLRISPVWGVNSNDSDTLAKEKRRRWYRLNTCHPSDMVALYNFLTTVDIKNFRSQQLLEKINQNAVVEHVNLQPPFQFIRDTFILDKQNMDTIVNTELYTQFEQYCKKNTINCYKRINFYNELTNIEIASKVGKQNKSTYTYTWQELKAIFKGRKLLTTAELYDGEDDIDVDKEPCQIISNLNENEQKKLREYFFKMFQNESTLMSTVDGEDREPVVAKEVVKKKKKRVVVEDD